MSSGSKNTNSVCVFRPAVRLASSRGASQPERRRVVKPTAPVGDRAHADRRPIRRQTFEQEKPVLAELALLPVTRDVVVQQREILRRGVEDCVPVFALLETTELSTV